MDPVDRKIEQAKQELEQMIDLNPQIMLLADREGRVTRANHALVELLGMDGYQQVIGKRLEDLFPGVGKVMKAVDDRIGTESGELAVTLPVLGNRILSFVSVVSGGRAGLRVVMVQDVTIERQMAAHRELQHKKEAVSALAGALMHNLNQSLTVIMVRAQLMNVMLRKGQVRHDEMSLSLHDIVKETTRVADILKEVSSPVTFVTESYPGGNDILDISKSTGKEIAGSASTEPRACLWLESSCAAMIESLLNSLDVHEPGATRHAKLTGVWSSKIARRMGLGEADAVAARRCGELHDIGKIGVGDAVLQKPSPLDAGELGVMKTHTEIGFAVLGAIPFLVQEGQVALLHHERMDGGGYPRGLKGESIPLFARIVAVADAFAAMTVARPYRPPMQADKAIREIMASAGTQFDRQPALALQAEVSGR